MMNRLRRGVIDTVLNRVVNRPRQGMLFDRSLAASEGRDARKSGNKPNQADDPLIREAD